MGLVFRPGLEALARHPNGAQDSAISDGEEIDSRTRGLPRLNLPPGEGQDWLRPLCQVVCNPFALRFEVNIRDEFRITCEVHTGISSDFCPHR